MPTVPIKRPKAAVMSPLMSDFPEMEMMTDKPNIASAKNSAGPNFNAIFEMSGDKKVITRAPMIPPLKEENKAIVNARPGSPFCPIGYPSSTVAAAAGVPGVWMRIAAMEPPYIPPQNIPSSIATPGIKSRP